MEEKERFNLLNDGFIYDNELKEYAISPSASRKLYMETLTNLLNKQDNQIKNLQKLNGETIVLNRTVIKDSQILEKENQQLKQSLEYANKQLDYFTNKFRSREFKRTGDWAKDIELYMKQLAIEELEKLKKEIDLRPVLVKNCGYGDFEVILLEDAYGVINRQIKKLKGEE